MAKTPILATHKLVFAYTLSGQTHHMAFYCQAFPSGDATGYDLQEFGITSVGLTAVIAQFVAKFVPVLPSTVTAAGWVLYLYSSGAYVPLTSGTWAATAPVGSFETCTQATFVMKDSSNLFIKHIVLESDFNPPDRRVSIASVGGTAATWLTDMADITPGHMGAWVQSRSGLAYQRFVSYVATLNRRLRRRRGLA